MLYYTLLPSVILTVKNANLQLRQERLKGYNLRVSDMSYTYVRESYMSALPNMSYMLNTQNSNMSYTYNLHVITCQYNNCFYTYISQFSPSA